jgi:hypothetical protein
VGLYFSCKNNPLKSLEGLPTKVGALTWVTWHESLPLLRLLDLTWFIIVDAPDQVTSIMNKYKGQGRAGSLACAAELSRVGFKGNARW